MDLHFLSFRKELPGLYELNGLIRNKPIKGILAPKPPNSEHYEEQYIYDFVGMLGLPLVPTAKIDPAAKAAFLPVHTLKDPEIRDKISSMLAAGKPVLITDGLAKRLDGFDFQDKNLHILKVKADPYNLHRLTREKLKAIRSPMLAPFGLEFDAPNKVALYLFGDDLLVIENFNDEPVTATLRISGLGEAQKALVLPADEAAQFSQAHETLDFTKIGPRTLVAVKYQRPSMQ